MVERGVPLTFMGVGDLFVYYCICYFRCLLLPWIRNQDDRVIYYVSCLFPRFSLV